MKFTLSIFFILKKKHKGKRRNKLGTDNMTSKMVDKSDYTKSKCIEVFITKIN